MHFRIKFGNEKSRIQETNKDKSTNIFLLKEKKENIQSGTTLCF